MSRRFLTATTAVLLLLSLLAPNAAAQNDDPGAAVPERTEYRHLEDYYAEIEALHEQYPDLTRVETLGHGHEGNPMVMLEISSAPGTRDGRPEYVHTGVTHAREWPTGEFAMNLAWYLLGNYGSDERVTDIVDSIRVFILPIYNPDGFDYSRTVEEFWRKNRNPEGSVDLNRNYAFMWGGVGSSGNPNSGNYRGEAPASEPETQAFQDWTTDKQLITAIHGHTHGGLWLYPWAHTEEPPPDPELAELAARATEWNGWQDGQWSTTLYDASGESTDWHYGMYRTLAFLPEHGYSHGFHWNYTGVEGPGIVTDEFNNIEARLLDGSPELAGETGEIVDCGVAASPDDCPDEVDGEIALVARSDASYADVAANAAAAGAIAVVISNDRWGHLNGDVDEDIDVPVIGIQQFDGERLREAIAESPVDATLDEVLRHSVPDIWDLNLPAYLLTIEAAAEYAAEISGTVTDASGQPLAATLELANERFAPYAQGGGTSYEHRTTLDVGEDGEFTWAVTPSEQPTVDSEPYELTATAPNHFPETVEVDLDGYGDTASVDVDLQPLASVAPPLGRRVIGATSTVPLRFVTYAPDGSLSDADDLSVTLYDDDGDEIAEWTLPGRGTSRIRDVADPGNYLVAMHLNRLGVDDGTYELVISFEHDGVDHDYTVPLEVTDPPRGQRP